MPLDAGDVAQGKSGAAASNPISGLRPVKFVLNAHGNVGEALRGAREALGLGADDIALVTRVRSAHISAIEAFDFASLPARPFVVGYVRAYAQALGLNAEAVVARFHAEAPAVDGKLRAPGGVRRDALGGVRWLLLSGVVVGGAVLVWNVTRRAELREARPDHAPTAIAAPPSSAAGPAQIGAPLPTPPEATTPPVYLTPGLAPAVSAKADHDDSHRGAVPPGLTDAPPGAAGAPFVAGGAIYGDSQPGAGVLLQARSPTSLVVRGAGGGVLFARLLAAGEAWRAPDTPGLVADVGEPKAVEVFVGGASRGRLTRAQTELARLTAP
jgi:hypothetical protein